MLIFLQILKLKRKGSTLGYPLAGALDFETNLSPAWCPESFLCMQGGRAQHAWQALEDGEGVTSVGGRGPSAPKARSLRSPGVESRTLGVTALCLPSAFTPSLSPYQ